MNPLLCEEELEAPLDAQTEAAIDEAMQHATDIPDQNAAISAVFNTEYRLLLIMLKTGRRLAIPQEEVQDLHDISPKDLVDIQVLGSGSVLYWQKSGEGLLVKNLADGLYGNDRWMATLPQRRRANAAAALAQTA